MRDNADYWRMRRLLIDTVPITPIAFNWDMRRARRQALPQRGSGCESTTAASRPTVGKRSGSTGGYVLAEGAGDTHIQVQFPDYRYLEGEMIAWVEEAPPPPMPKPAAGEPELVVNEYDALRQQPLAERGFVKMSYGGMCRHLRLGYQPLPAPELNADGYTLRHRS